MLTQTQKNAIIDARLQDYDVKIYNLEIDLVALTVIGDEVGIAETQTRIESLQKARTEVEKLKVIEDANA